MRIRRPDFPRGSQPKSKTAALSSPEDEGAAVQAFIGVPGYEYFYICDRENTEKLFTLLAGGGRDPLEQVGRDFHGMDCAGRFRKFCDENQIACVFDTVR